MDTVGRNRMHKQTTSNNYCRGLIHSIGFVLRFLASYKLYHRGYYEGSVHGRHSTEPGFEVHYCDTYMCVCVYVDYERIALITIPTPSLCEETASKARAWAVCT